MPNPENIEKYKWQKGQSGNPKGRPPKLPDLEKILAEVLGEEKDGVTAAQAIMMKLRQKASKGDIRAAEVLMDRAYGKALQEHRLSGGLRLKIIETTDDGSSTGEGGQGQAAADPEASPESPS